MSSQYSSFTFYRAKHSRFFSNAPVAAHQVIKRIELINFMSHRHTVIEPADGLTVLIGPNNCGKSAFVTALQILCHNSKSGFVLRHGEKNCEVIVETADGHVINWSRKKNGSPIYKVDGKQHDRLRGSVPDEVHEILKMPKVKCDNEEFDVHFGEQSEPVFLLRDRGKASAQFFASSSDATYLVAMQSLHKAKVLVHKRDFKQLTRQHKSVTEQLESLEPLSDLEKNLLETEKQFADLQTEAIKLEQVEKLISAIRSAQTIFDRFKKQATSLQLLASPPEISDERPLGSLIDSITSTAAKGIASQAIAEAFGGLSNAPAIKPAAPLEQLLQQIKTKHSLVRQSTECAKSFEELTPVPMLPDPAGLQQLVHKLIDRHRSSVVAERMLAAVTPTPALPKQTDVVALSQMLDLIGAKQRQLQARTKQFEQADQELVDLQSEFEAWVADNPVCPTCGSETDTQHVLQQHDHSQANSSGEFSG